MSHYKWEKGSKVSLSNNFSTDEFDCHCKLDTCKEQKISIKLISKLQDLRDAFGSSLDVVSGYRCPEHNKNIGGALKSQHMQGEAADIACKDLQKLEKLADDHFEAIGDGKHKGFLHLDTRSDKKRRWTY